MYNPVYIIDPIQYKLTKYDHYYTQAHKHQLTATCIDQIGILLALSWIGSHSQKPVLGLQHHMYPGRDIIARHSGHPDTYMMRERVEWDVE